MLKLSGVLAYARSRSRGNIMASSGAFVAATSAIAIASTVASVVAMKKARKKVSGAQSQVERQQTLRSTAPINRIYGKMRRAGLLVFAEEQTGDQAENEQLHLILELASHHCSRVSDIEVDKQKFDNFASHVRCTLYTGEQTTADPHIVANSQSWTDECIGKDKRRAVSLTADVDKFPYGIPNLTFLVEGAKVHDREIQILKITGRITQRYAS